MCACRGASGFAHVSCLARQAQVALERGGGLGFDRWHTCGLCEQAYHGLVACALGWACWKTYLGRPETDWQRRLAMGQLGNGLSAAKRHEEALLVREAELSIERRLCTSENDYLIVQSNLATTYDDLGRSEAALRLRREVYSGILKLYGEEHEVSLRESITHSTNLIVLGHFEEAKSLLRKVMPVARRVLGENASLTLVMRWTFAMALYNDTGATLEDRREAATTLEDAERIARRVFGGAHPTTAGIEKALRGARAALRAREAPPPPPPTPPLYGEDELD